MKQLGLLIILAVIFSLSLFSQGNGTYHQFDLEVDGLAREYTLYVPEGHDGSKAWPLVFNFHMANSNIDDQIKISEMYLVADTAKFLIVYPTGLPVLVLPYAEYGTVPGWNVPDLNDANQDDVSFVSKIIDDLVENPSYNIDLNRIHATGISSGGAFSYYLAFKLSNRIASVSAVAAPLTDTLINDICIPVRQISVLHIQGTDDPSVPANGWPEYGIFPFMGVTDYWSNVNGCNAIPDSLQLEDVDQNDNSTVTLFDYEGCDQEYEVLLYRINGGGHTWPGGWMNPNWGLGAVNKDINASSEIWSFFKRNPHPSPYVDIPDTAFLIALIEEGVDTNGDSLISYLEAKVVTSLDIGGDHIIPYGCQSNRGIQSLEGIKAFTNLDSLNCRCNSINSLDISTNKALVYLNCEDNQLTSLDVSACGSLEVLHCFSNPITSLDLSNNPALKDLFCAGNQLSNLDVSNNHSLTRLICGENKLTSLNLGYHPDLTLLTCVNNQLTTIDVSNCPALNAFDCSSNFFISLDISKNPALGLGEGLWGWQPGLYIGGMSTLNEICVWDNFSTDSLDIDTTGSPNVCFQTDCNGDCSILGRDESFHTELHIYPNPTNTLLNIETVTNEVYNIEIVSINGQLIYSLEMEGTNHQLDLSSFQKGVYIITIRSKDFVAKRKIIKLQ